MGKNNNDFFTVSKKQYGEDFLKYMNTKDLQNRAVQIFRQIARGQVDIIENKKYFVVKEFLEACLIASRSKLTLHSISRDGIELLQNSILSCNGNVGTDIPAVLDFHTRAAEAYNIIYNTLMYINNTGDVDSLIPISQNLSNYRNYI